MATASGWSAMATTSISITRGGYDWTRRFPWIAEAIEYGFSRSTGVKSLTMPRIPTIDGRDSYRSPFRPDLIQFRRRSERVLPSKQFDPPPRRFAIWAATIGIFPSIHHWRYRGICCRAAIPPRHLDPTDAQTQVCPLRPFSLGYGPMDDPGEDDLGSIVFERVGGLRVCWKLHVGARFHGRRCRRQRVRKGIEDRGSGRRCACNI